MAFNIEQGLFKFDFTDHHAVLGVPLDATANEIRKRYLKISRSLHPDSCVADNEASKQHASQLFAKLVNPAYEQLFGDQNRAEHKVLLRNIGKRLVQERNKIELHGELAKHLNKSGNLDHDYKTALQKLIEKQYESINHILEQTAQISELNLVYLLRKEMEGKPVGPSVAEPAKSAPPTTNTGGAKTPVVGMPPKEEKKPVVKQESPAETYCRRAEEYIEKNHPSKAILELKDALKLEPKNSRTHALMAKAYLSQAQPKMAKIYLESALQFNPEDPTALEVKKQMQPPPPKTPVRPSGGTRTSGGLFGLFGGGKKK